jgi:hypothetical protein
MDLWRGWHSKQNNFVWDVANYYSYLPAKLCNNNSFDFKNGVEGFLPYSPLGERMPKVTYGMALLYSPFFALGYKIAFNQDSPRDGFSEPFSTALHWGSIFYGLFGLIFLRNFLVKFYNEFVVTITLAICFFGTNLFYYTMANSEMTHGYLFFLISAFLLMTYKWHQSPGLGKSVLIGFLLGVICLIRPTEVLTGLIFVFWGVSNKIDFKFQVNKFWKYKFHLLLMLIMIILVWLPQLIFWKERTGSYFFFSYGDEKFFWADPQIINVLFSYRKGWVMYSPLIILAFIGFFFMKGKSKKLSPVILLLLILNVYILSCWWDWFFGGGFGARAFTQHIAYLSLPIAACTEFLVTPENYKKSLRFIRIVFFVVVFSGISLSLGQTYQYIKLYIHHSSMCKEAYWHVFGKYYLNSTEAGIYWNKIREPDYKKLKSGEDRSQ